MQTAVNYWKKTHNDEEGVVAHLVWAGLEPLEFTNLFPMWEVREDVKELNLQDELSEKSKSLLAAKKDELDASSQQWRARVEKSDAEKFSVAGKMGEKIKEAVPTINIPSAEKAKRTPQAKRYKGKEDSSSTPSSPEKNSHFDLTRSKSAISPIAHLSRTPDVISTPIKVQSRVIPILRPDDFTFTAFFESVEQSKKNNER